jgi:hypothetical protein
MLRLGGADETIVRDIENIRHFTEIAGHFIRKLAGAHIAGTRGLDHLQAVLVGTGLKEDVAAVLALEARDRIGGDHLIGMADMRAAIGIMDCCRDVEGIGHSAALGAARSGGNPTSAFNPHGDTGTGVAGRAMREPGSGVLREWWKCRSAGSNSPQMERTFTA